MVCGVEVRAERYVHITWLLVSLFYYLKKSNHVIIKTGPFIVFIIMYQKVY